MVAFLLVLQFLQSSDSQLSCDSGSGGVGPGTTSYCFHSGTTVPDAHSSSLYLGFTTKGPSVLSVLAYFSFLQHFPEGSIITVQYLLMILTFLVHLAVLLWTRCKPREQQTYSSFMSGSYVLSNFFLLIVFL